MNPPAALSLAELPEPPAPVTGHARELRRRDGERARLLLAASRTGWIGPPEAEHLKSRTAAISRAKRLVACLQEIEGPGSKFERRIWQEGSRFRWAIRRKAAEPVE